MISDHIYTVSELTREITFLLEDTFRTIWIQGEISNLKIHSSGHVYFVLKDKESQIKAVLFRTYRQGITFELEDGLSVIVQGDISVYGKRGDYQVYVKRMEPTGIGALQLAFEQLKEKLFKEGLFDERHKKPIPLFPGVIAIVTSITGAAIKDILKVLGRRFPEVHLLIYPVKVQGEGAAEEIANAINQLNSIGEADVLIVGRGGGSIEDLWAFNEEILARAIFNSQIPVISAIGHEIDWTIADYVSDVRAPTPSAAAEQVIAEKMEMKDRLRYFADIFERIIMRKLQIIRHRYEISSSSYVFRQPLKRIYDYRQVIDELYNRLSRTMKNRFRLFSNELLRFTEKMEALNPLQVLKRGYSITVREGTGEIIRNTGDLQIGENVKTRVYKGEFVSTIGEIINKKKKDEKN